MTIKVNEETAFSHSSVVIPESVSLDADLIAYWRQQAEILEDASRDDGMTDEQRDLSIGTAKGLRFCANALEMNRRPPPSDVLKNPDRGTIAGNQTESVASSEENKNSASGASDCSQIVVEKDIQLDVERVIRVLGPEQVSDLAHQAVGVWQAFQDNHLFSNTKESWLKAHNAAEDAREIARLADSIQTGKCPECEAENGWHRTACLRYPQFTDSITQDPASAAAPTATVPDHSPASPPESIPSSDISSTLAEIRERLTQADEKWDRFVANARFDMASLLSIIDSLQVEKGELKLTTASGAFIHEVHDQVLRRARCEVAGHFWFQENGGNCMMCQREQQAAT